MIDRPILHHPPDFTHLRNTRGWIAVDDEDVGQQPRPDTTHPIADPEYVGIDGGGGP
jgi:hypothetical protein